jgi:hypothetical protein
MVIEELADDDSVPGFTQWDINFIANRVPGEKMKKEVWDSLLPQTRTVWDTLPSTEKAKILNAAMDRAERVAARDAATPPVKDARPRRSVNFSEIINAELAQDDDADEASGNDPTDALEVNHTLQQLNEAKGKVPPGNLHRMLGRQTPSDSASTKPAPASSLKGTKGTSAQSVNTITWSAGSTNVLPATGPPHGTPRAPHPGNALAVRKGTPYVSRPRRSPGANELDTWGVSETASSGSDDPDDLDFY